ncbi:2-keto-3-deoxy-L-rhamnonate aldolase [Maritimibacter sp. 55A14]|uniref:HpcH/HpaI aldolase family protein n=1 Tax=Maritimibacter sp. 55A14 TaxID=2174844 RepID=UPI000D603319|nr:HpcH/HpaI aldolase/citrate lyase family protein [Maritimibacter sp. 55A14]PWE30619.1 2-keto-3-deoxy-L-rhamnonate aldolase [Maritimibacter sp. 55A14]
MPAPVNRLKAALAAGRRQIGLWQALASPAACEICANAGFDWLLLDAEHGPNTLTTLQAQLQAMNGSPASAMIRPPVGQDWVVKQMLELGAQSFLIPMVETAAQAADAVAMLRYPPEGRRGAGAALARASGYNAQADYVATANAQICTIVQAESRRALANLDAILAVEGVDGVFLGPADLAADMSRDGPVEPAALDAALEGAIARIAANGKAAGIIAFDSDRARHYLGLGAKLVAVGSDVTIFAQSVRDLADLHRDG